MMYIYTLSDPDGSVRYVGRTKNPSKRLSGHLAPSNLKHGTHKNHWIKQLLGQGLKPAMTVIEEVDDLDWSEAERRWIAHYRSLGCNLTNSTDGGDGVLNMPRDIVEKVRAANMNRTVSEETRRKISEARTGSKRDPLAAAKCAEKLRGRRQPEQAVAARTETRKRLFAAKCNELWPKVIALYNEGMSLIEIAKTVGLSRTTVSAELKRHGVEIRSKEEGVGNYYSTRRESMGDKIVDAYLKLRSIKAVSAATGASPSLIKKVLIKRSVDIIHPQTGKLIAYQSQQSQLQPPCETSAGSK